MMEESWPAASRADLASAVREENLLRLKAAFSLTTASGSFFRRPARHNWEASRS